MCEVYDRRRSEPLEEKVANFCRAHNINLNQNTDIVAIGRQLDFDIFKLPLDDEQLDGVILCENDDKLIGVNESLDMQDSRFVVAHEIAHYIWEKSGIEGDGAPLFAKRDKILHGKDKSDLENDMDYMAAAMLVPREQFEKDLTDFNINLNDIIDHEERTVLAKVNPKVIGYLAIAYNVKPRLIIRRIAELSHYVG